MRQALLNGHVRCTLIESFSGEVSVIRPGFRKKFDKGLPEARSLSMIMVEHLHLYHQGIPNAQTDDPV